jgi:hypothetical protein
MPNASKLTEQWQIGGLCKNWDIAKCFGIPVYSGNE